jgi:tRNA threonylcarbamoyladenosine biosynthesis protein TsaE
VGGQERDVGRRVRSGIDLVTMGAEHTREIGARLGRRLRPGDVVLLHGDLGAGKTTLAQGIARGLGIVDAVQSPTFTLINQHEREGPDGEPFRLYHVDLYRLAGEEELDSFGFDDYLDPSDGVTLIEWPERAASRLPARYLLIRLDTVGESKRRLVIEAVKAEGELATMLAGLRRELAGVA